MEKTSALLGNISSSTSRFVQLQARSAKLEVYERITNLISSGISTAFIFLFSAIAFLFINLTLAFWLSEVYHSYKAGFFVLAVFYTLLLLLYLALRHRIAKNHVKNAVLYKVSREMKDYELLLQEQEQLHQQIEVAEQTLKENFETLKDNIHELKEDFDHLKENFVGSNHSGKHVGPKLPRIAITSAIDFALQHLIFKKAGFVKKTLLPIVANALVTSSVFKEDKKTSFVENLKLKFSKFL